MRPWSNRPPLNWCRSIRGPNIQVQEDLFPDLDLMHLKQSDLVDLDLMHL